MSDVRGGDGKNGADAERFGLVVLGMHRSGTSAVTGMLRLCGAWVGEDDRLTVANVENPRGFWERRDVRKICDVLLHSAGADWWKIANLNLEAVPHAVLSEQRRRFAEVVSEFGEHGAWVVKEPRLCLLLPLLRDYLDAAVCVHVFRNPLEVARSLQRRNGFSIAAGMALWEAYNRCALKASSPMPRVMVGYGALMRDPETAIGRLVARLRELGVKRVAVPDESVLRQFIQPEYHRHRVTEKETGRYLTADQKSLWKRVRAEDVLAWEPGKTISAAATQHLYDLESSQRSLRHHEDRIRELDAKMAEYREALTARETELASRDRDIAARDEALGRRAREVAARERRIRDLLDSASWRITAPLRALTTAARKGPGAIARSLRRVRRAATRQFASVTGSTSRIGTSLAGAGSSAAGVMYADTASLRELVRRHREINNRRTEEMSSDTPPETERRTKISVIAWNMGHNALGRAYLIADLLRSDYDVEVIGAIFPQFGTELWGPLRNCSRVTLKFFPGSEFPEHFHRMEEVAGQIDGDVIYVSKPRLPALELAILAKLQRNRPIVLDVDDHELGWFRNRAPLTLEEVTRSERHRDHARPQAETWTRYCESLVPLFDQITVSNEELRKKFGGVILPHVRSEHDYEPGAWPRDQVRAALGFRSEDKVVLFAGTLRMHKGVERIVDAVRKLRRLGCKLMIVGTPPDDETRALLRGVDPAQVRIIGDVQFHDLPGYLCAGDLVCLLQEPDDATSQFQMPAKFTDALAMGIPVLASNAPPLMNLARDGLVELLGSTPLEKKIEEMLLSHHVHRVRAQENRGRFLSKYSYGACRSWMKSMIDRLLEVSSPTPAEFRDLIDHHRGVFAGSCASRTAPKACLTVRPPGDTGIPDGEVTVPPVEPRERRRRTYVDDKIDIVFFWKQNDTGIYGRRQDMLVKYLAMEPRINRIFHFDAPVNLLRSGGVAARTGGMGSHSHARLVLFNTLRRRYFRGQWTKVRHDTFIWFVSARAPRLMKWLLPCEDDYLDYLERVFGRYDVGERRVIFWVCPNNFHFPAIERRFQPDLIVADVIDDQRKWDIPSAHRDNLEANYREILGRSDLVFSNCERVLRSMQEFSKGIHLFPNAAEMLEQDARSWKKPEELTGLRGPIIGYVGNLDIARIDFELLETIAANHHDWNFVFIGSMHRGREIKRLNKFRNVYFLGVRVYDRAIRYIRFFDVAIIPHLDNELTRSMNPLKLYVYSSLHVPVVATPIENMGDFGHLVKIGRTPEEFTHAVKECLKENIDMSWSVRLKCLVATNSWTRRVADMMQLIDANFAGARDGATEQGEPGIAPCNICGGNRFTSGPGGRNSPFTHRKPRCVECGSLERHRFVRGIWNKVLDGDFEGMHAIQFSYDRAVDPRWFDSVEVSIFGCRNSLDLQAIDRADGSYDVAICNHVLEHIGNDREGFRELIRILKPEGILQFSVPFPQGRSTTEDWGYAKPELHGHYRIYGRDLVERFAEARSGVRILEVAGVDDVTGTPEFVYFASCDKDRIETLRSRVGAHVERVVPD